MDNKRLMRGDDRLLLGVCSGFAEYVGMDPTIIRIAVLIITLLSWRWISAMVLYLIVAAIMPTRDNADIAYGNRAPAPPSQTTYPQPETEPYVKNGEDT